MNDFERAVIKAARDLVRSEDGDLREWIEPLRSHVLALEEHKQAMAATGISEVGWHLVTEGDELKGKSGAFFRVVATKREWKMGRPTGNFLITVKLPSGDKVLTRPTESEPMATVRRGDTGTAVDNIVHVFTSGEA